VFDLLSCPNVNVASADFYDLRLRNFPCFDVMGQCHMAQAEFFGCLACGVNRHSIPVLEINFNILSRKIFALAYVTSAASSIEHASARAELRRIDGYVPSFRVVVICIDRIDRRSVRPGFPQFNSSRFASPAVSCCLLWICGKQTCRRKGKDRERMARIVKRHQKPVEERDSPGGRSYCDNRQ